MKPFSHHEKAPNATRRGLKREKNGGFWGRKPHQARVSFHGLDVIGAISRFFEKVFRVIIFDESS